MDSLDLFFGVLSSSLFGLKACLHKTNWSSQPPESILPCQPPLSNSAWWATGAALQAPLQPVLSLSHQVRSLGPLIVDSTHSILSLAHQILYFALLTVTLFPITPLMSQHASSSSQTIPSQSNERLLSRMKDGKDRDYTIPAGFDTRSIQGGIRAVKQFRKGKISKAEAILEIQASLTSKEVEPSNEELLSALSSYLTILDDIQEAG
jgi:hypothetical protein